MPNTETLSPERPTLLLVDDAPINLELVLESLEREGYEVLVALDGEEALERAARVRPDLILLDVMLPGVDGFEVCRRLKAHPELADIPVIFMTSLSAPRDKLTGFAAGGVDYITKPLQLDETRARIQVHLKLRALNRQLDEHNAELTREIAERIRAEQALRDREDEARRLAAGLAEAQRIGHMGSWELDLASGRLVWSDEIYRIFEIDKGGFAASYPAFLERVHPDDRAMVDRAYAESVRERRLYQVDHRLLLPDGRVKHVREQGETFYARDGKPLLSRGTVQDITEIKETQIMLERSRAELRLLAARRDAEQEDERRELAHAMHEELGQTLVALRMKAARLYQHCRECDNDEVDALGDDILAMSEAAIRSIRRLVADIRPTTLDMGIVPALEWLADDFTQGLGIPCRFQAEDRDCTLVDTTATALFRLAQEALTNVALHADAHQVDMILRRDGDALQLTITDDGRGIRWEDLRKPTLGILGMREQLAVLGGTLNVGPGDKEGTVVRIRVPARL